MIYRCIITFMLITICNVAYSEQTISQEIDQHTWSVISQAVANADIEAMASTYHPDAVVVSAEKTSPIKSTLVNWGEGMKKAAKDGTKASVSFRFASRIDNDSSAFETGIFKYTSIDASGKETRMFMNFETLLVKKDNRWLYLMEHQLDESDETSWNNLAN